MPLKKATPAVGNAVNFGDLGMYTGGSAVPEADYALEFMAMNWKPESGKFAERLGMMVTCHPLAGGEAKTKFMALGTDAHKYFAPNPDTGKGIVPIPGVEGTPTLSKSSNWALFLKSMYDCGLPIGIFTNDVSVLDGVHVHLSNEPEPEERKGFKPRKANTAESEGHTEEPRGDNKILVVTEIKPDGMPWEGNGGIPDAAAPKPAAVAPKPAVGKLVPKPAAKAAPAPAATTELTEEEVMDAALAGVTAVLEKNPNGTFTVGIRTGAFKSVKDTYGDDAAQAVATFISDDGNLGAVVGQLGYKVNGKKVEADA